MCGNRFQHCSREETSGDAGSIFICGPRETSHWLSAEGIIKGGERCPGEVCNGLRSKGPLLPKL